MTRGVGGSTAEVELAKLRPMRDGAVPVGDEERQSRVAQVQRQMKSRGIDALYLDASTSTFYFTGLRIRPSERLHGVLIPAEGEIAYVCPAFEEAKLRASLSLPGGVHCWEEHEDPTARVTDTLAAVGVARGAVAIDPATPFFTFDGLRRAGNAYDFVNGRDVIAACRMIKSPAEIALISH